MKEAITADLDGERRTRGSKLAVQDVPAKGHAEARVVGVDGRPGGLQEKLRRRTTFL